MITILFATPPARQCSNRPRHTRLSQTSPTPPARTRSPLTVQNILTSDLQPGPDPEHLVETFWHNIDLDLTDATFINFNLYGGYVRTGVFEGAEFAGDAWFNDANFEHGTPPSVVDYLGWMRVLNSVDEDAEADRPDVSERVEPRCRVWMVTFV